MPKETGGARTRVVPDRGKWSIEYWEPGPDGKPVRRRASTGLPATPECYESALRAEAKVRRQLEAPRSRLIRDVWAAYRAQTKALDTERMDWAWRQLQGFFGSIDCDEITREDCARYAVLRGVSAGTIRKELTVLRAAVRWVSPNTPSVFELPDAPPPRDRWLTRQEFDRLLDAAGQTPHLQTFLHLAIGTCARREAILTLPWTCVSLVSSIPCPYGQITLPIKPGGKRRANVVPINRSLRAELDRAKLIARTPWVVEYADRQVKNVRHAFENAVARAGLEDVHIHDLRHTGAVWMRMAGVSLEKIAELLGHSSIEVTRQVYARFSPDYLADAVNAVEVKRD